MPYKNKIKEQIMREQKSHSKQQSQQNAANVNEMHTSREEMALLAYQLWRERGCPEGTAEEDWFHAEERLKHETPTDDNLVAA